MSIHVVVAVILKNNQVLIAQRAKEAHQGGLWEFPGGKMEAGETVEQACIREIQEELGITISHSRPLIKILHHYSDKSVLLETFLCTHFSGKEYLMGETQQFGLENQRVQWVKIDQLNNYQFPAANQSIINSLLLPDKYLISPDCPVSGRQIFLQQFSESCKYYSLIQLRIKSLKTNDYQSVINECCRIADNNNVKLLLNSSHIKLTDTENNYDYDGIHLTSVHLFDNDYIDDYRSRFPGKIISASCHRLEDIEQANDKKLDFIALSPVQKTTSHPQQRPLGWSYFAKLCEVAKMPCFALGGMSINDIGIAQTYGAQGIAGISGFWKNKIRDEDETAK
ncbi:MAG: Nudix family hydrolase [gamma proteobacterium symbiont of Taylorina sp.]|nr:Nudix family hydrolase [gamma proteobacterium symbiont of Taylorina sp.]